MRPLPLLVIVSASLLCCSGEPRLPADVVTDARGAPRDADGGGAADAGAPDGAFVDAPDAAREAPDDAGDSRVVDADTTPDAPGDVPPDGVPDGVPDGGGDGGGDVAPDVPDHDALAAACEALATPCIPAVWVDGVCVAGAKDCREVPEDDPCTVDACHPQTGACVHQAHPDCFVCATDDDCDDLDPCTRDACEPSGRCRHEATGAPCDDRNPCTTGEACVADPTRLQSAYCGGGAPRSCDDGDPCTVDWCDPRAADPCRHLTLVAPCDLRCDAATPCPQLNGYPCHGYRCDVAAGVCVPYFRSFPNARCDDRDPCTVDDRCVEGVCRGRRRICDDGDIATSDTCLPESGRCVHAAVPDDVRCEDVSDCPPAEGPCREVVCAAGICLTLNREGPCEDGNACTVDETCRDGACTGGHRRDCSATCPDTVCDPDRGCVRRDPDPCEDALPAGPCERAEDCDDGDPCTHEACLAYLTPGRCACSTIPYCACHPGAADGGASACEDDDPCTIDTCVPNDDPATPQHPGFCTHVPDVATCCETPCGGEGDDAVCDDGDGCTVDMCVPYHQDSDAWCCTNPILPPPCGLPCDGPEDCDDGNPGTETACGPDGRCEAPAPVR